MFNKKEEKQQVFVEVTVNSAHPEDIEAYVKKVSDCQKKYPNVAVKLTIVEV